MAAGSRREGPCWEEEQGQEGGSGGQGALWWVLKEPQVPLVSALDAHTGAPLADADRV